MDRADIFFDLFYNSLMDKCIDNIFIKHFCREIYLFIIKQIEECYEQNVDSDNYDENKIKDCRKKMCKIINLFEETDEKSGEFLRKFPKWKKCRKENIKLLNKISDDLHDEKKVLNAINVISSVVGLAGGAAILGSIFFPPAAIVTLPVWLGGSAVAALLPASVLSVVGTTTAAVTGGVAAVANGTSKIVSSIAELKLLKEHMDEATAIISEDQKLFEDLKELFNYTDSLSDVLKDIFDFQIVDYIFKDVLEFLKLMNKFHNKFNDYLAIKLINLLQKYISKFTRSLDIPLEYRIAIIGVLFVMLLVYKNNCFLFNAIVGAYQIMMGHLSLATAFSALTTTSAVTSANTASQVLARNVRLGAFTGIGMALDVITIVKTSIDIEKGSQSEHGEKIRKVSDELKEELKAVEDFYNELQRSMLRSMFLESQKPLQ